MKKPKQEDFELHSEYGTALEKYIEFIETGLTAKQISHYHSLKIQDKIHKEVISGLKSKNPDKIIKINNIHLDLDKIEYIREVDENSYKIYFMGGKIFEVLSKDFKLTKLIEIWKRSKEN